MSTDLERALHRTLAWFSLFEMPLTAFELWKWLYAPARRYALAEVYEALDTSPWLATKAVHQDGFWALASAPIDHWIAGRQTRFLDAHRKFMKLRRAAYYFSLLPSVRGVAAGNTLAWFATGPESDIDLFIVVKPESLWTSRLLLVLPFALLGQRPPAARDPFCFSFFASDTALCLETLRLSDGDPYFAYWTRSLVPVLDRDRIFVRVGQENAWITQELPHAVQKVGHTTLAPHLLPSILRLPAICEVIARRFQERRFPSRIRALMNQDSRVIVNDAFLKFHDTDRRAEYRDRFLALTSYDT